MTNLRMIWMGLALLGALGFLQTSAQDHDPVQPDFQKDKFLGRWFSAGLASNSSWFREKKSKLSVCRTVVAPSKDGGLNLTATFLRNGQCETKIIQLRPEDKPGRYTYRSLHLGSVHSVSVVETNYDEYAILYSKGTKDSDQDFRVVTLYSRTRVAGAKPKDKFSAFCKAQGLTEDDIVFLPQADNCIQEQE